MSFQKWTVGNRDNEQGHMFIRFSGTKQLHLSMELTNAIMGEWKEGPPEEVGEPAFSIYVDAKRRLIGIAPKGGGDFKFRGKTLPPVFGMAPFVNQYKPVTNKRLYVKQLKGDGRGRPWMWVANMDGGMVRLPREKK